MRYITVLVLFFLLTSCVSKKLIYFQDVNEDQMEVAIPDFTLTIKSDDLLSIIITANDPLVTAPFNIMPTSQMIHSNNNNGYTTGNREQFGYLVDKEGYVSLPIIGKVELLGLTRNQAIDTLQAKLSKYINNPIVQLQVINFKVTVLGDVKNPGTYKIPNERITLLETIGLAGDLNITGLRDNVLVIREIDGEKEYFTVDLRNANFMNSEVYYLQQNDVVYITPNNAARTYSTVWRTSGAVIVSIAALIITTVSLISN